MLHGVKQNLTWSVGRCSKLSLQFIHVKFGDYPRIVLLGIKRTPSIRPNQGTNFASKT